MSRTTRPTRSVPAALLGVLVALLLVAGCSTTVAGTPSAFTGPVPAEGPGSDPVVWVDRVCSAVVAFAVPATKKPDFTANADLPAVQRTFSGYLGAVVAGVQQGRIELNGLGRPPVEAGDDVLGRVQSSLTFLEQDFTGAKATIDGADPANPAVFSSTLAQVEATLSSITPPDALGDVSAHPVLREAAERAPGCQRLSSLSAAVPR